MSTSARARSTPAEARRAGRSRARAPRDFARCEMRPSCRGRATNRIRTVPARVRRRACSPNSAAAIGAPDRRRPSRLLERRCELGIGPFRREREVASARERILGELREAAVRTLPLGSGEPLIEDRGKQRMREADLPFEFDHLILERRVERARVDARVAELGQRQPSVGGDKDERVTGRAREAVEPGGNDLLQTLGNRQRLRRIADDIVRAECPRELEREEGLPPDTSCSLSSVGRGTVRESRSRTIRWIAPTLSGPTRSGGSDRGRERPRQRTARGLAEPTRPDSRMLASGSRRRAKPIALAEEASSHWRSSIARTSSSSASNCRALRTATPRARESTG